MKRGTKGWARAVAVVAWALCLVTVWFLLLRGGNADAASADVYMVLHGAAPPALVRHPGAMLYVWSRGYRIASQIRDPTDYWRWRLATGR